MSTPGTPSPASATPATPTCSNPSSPPSPRPPPPDLGRQNEAVIMRWHDHGPVGGLLGGGEAAGHGDGGAGAARLVLGAGFPRLAAEDADAGAAGGGLGDRGGGVAGGGAHLAGRAGGRGDLFGVLADVHLAVLDGDREGIVGAGGVA